MKAIKLMVIGVVAMCSLGSLAANASTSAAQGTRRHMRMHAKFAHRHHMIHKGRHLQQK